MGEVTKIEWCDHTFNPWIGCTKVSVGPKGACESCYAEAMMADRYHRVVWGRAGEEGTRARTSEAYWKTPLRWDRKAATDGRRPFVFCASLADVFDNQVPQQWRADLLELAEKTPRLTWLLLTKRPQNIVKMAQALGYGAELSWPGNAAIGCSVVTQAEANRDVPALLSAKGLLKPAFAFLSMEPLMGAVDLQDIRLPDGRQMQALRGSIWRGSYWTADVPRIDWVITGGETDQGKHRARPSHPGWFRSLRDECAAAGVSYHHKQNGEWGEMMSGAHGYFEIPFGEAGPRMMKVGKKATGRLLDGREHNDRPSVREVADIARRALQGDQG